MVHIYLQCDNAFETNQDFKWEIVSLKGDDDPPNMFPFYAELTDRLTSGFPTCTQVLRVAGFDDGAEAKVQLKMTQVSDESCDFEDWPRDDTGAIIEPLFIHEFTFTGGSNPFPS